MFSQRATKVTPAVPNDRKRPHVNPQQEHQVQQHSTQSMTSRISASRDRGEPVAAQKRARFDSSVNHALITSSPPPVARRNFKKTGAANAAVTVASSLMSSSFAASSAFNGGRNGQSMGAAGAKGSAAKPSNTGLDSGRSMAAQLAAARRTLHGTLASSLASPIPIQRTRSRLSAADDTSDPSVNSENQLTPERSGRTKPMHNGRMHTHQRRQISRAHTTGSWGGTSANSATGTLFSPTFHLVFPSDAEEDDPTPVTRRLRRQSSLTHIRERALLHYSGYGVVSSSAEGGLEGKITELSRKTTGAVVLSGIRTAAAVSSIASSRTSASGPGDAAADAIRDVQSPRMSRSWRTVSAPEITASPRQKRELPRLVESPTNSASASVSRSGSSECQEQRQKQDQYADEDDDEEFSATQELVESTQSQTEAKSQVANISQSSVGLHVSSSQTVSYANYIHDSSEDESITKWISSGKPPRPPHQKSDDVLLHAAPEDLSSTFGSSDAETNLDVATEAARLPSYQEVAGPAHLTYGLAESMLTTVGDDGEQVLQQVVFDEEEEEFWEEDEFDPYLFIASLPPSGVPGDAWPAHLGGNTYALPAKAQEHMHRHTLVLDLDETLVHCSTDGMEDAHLQFPVEFSGIKYDVFAKVRPGFQEFLESVSQLFEVVVFTASQQAYADTLLGMLDPEQKWIHHRMFRDSCVYFEGNYLKDLTVLGRDLHSVMIVDNSPQTFGLQIDNGIPIESWYDDAQDCELMRLVPFLKELAAAPDVRPHIRNKFRSYKRVERWRTAILEGRIV